MHNVSLKNLWARAWRWLSMDGRLRPAQPLALLLGPLALALALVAPYQGLFVLAYGFLLLPLTMYCWVRVLGPRVALRRQLLAEWAQVGDELAEAWLVENRAPLPLLWLELDDASTLPGYTGRRVVAAAAGSTQQWQTTANCTQRGVYTLGPLTATLGDPFGLFRYSWRDTHARQIVIYPPLVRLPPLLVPQGRRGGLAHADLLQINVTPSVGGLREYTPGDPPSRIHWPTVARTDKLMIKEFDQERAGAFWIALDLHAPAYAAADAASRPDTFTRAPRGDDAVYDVRNRLGAFQRSVVEASLTQAPAASALELAVVLACSLAAQALAEGRAVGLLADDGQRRLVMPGLGPRQLWRILGALVDARATGVLPLAELLCQGHAARASETAGAALAVITPALDGLWLPALASWQGHHSGGALALLLAPTGAQSAPLAARLAASGVAAHSFELGVPLPLLNPPKPRSSARMSPLGKVVRE
jgi:uncharacterized protein (DUF58 family)